MSHLVIAPLLLPLLTGIILIVLRGSATPLRRLVSITASLGLVGIAVALLLPSLLAPDRIRDGSLRLATRFFHLPMAGLLMLFGGLLTLGSAVIIHLLTLPTEFDASFGRALPLMKKQDVLYESDEKHARRLLLAAAMTYVAASLMSLLNVARWIAILRR